MRPRQPKTKTFTGCWTCRKRKLRCNGPKPTCQRCTRAGLACEGFDIRLSWAESPAGSPVLGAGRQPSYRERIIIPRGSAVLASFDVDEAQSMLKWLDDRANHPNADACIGPFSVFQMHQDVLETQVNGGAREVQSSSTTPFQPLDGDNAINGDDADDAIDVDYAIDADDSIEETVVVSMKSPSCALLRQSPSGGRNGDSLALEHISCEGMVPETTAVPSLVGIIPSVIESSLPLTETLLAYYMANVADLLVPVHHPQNPFRSIHLRFATALEVGHSRDSLNHASKSTRCSKSSIFCSLVSTAAFHLREQDGVQDEMKTKLDQIGKLYRVNAIAHLREALALPSMAFETHYLKVSAILTLVTSSVMEGTMNEVLTHLHGCEKLREAYHPRVQGSCGLDQALYTRQLDATSCFLSTLARTTLHQRPDLFLLPTPLDLSTLCETPFTDADTCLEFTYGITSTLASFIYLISKFWFYSRPSADINVHASAELGKAIATLHARLRSWTTDSEIFGSIPTGNGSSLQLVRHLAASYHSASQIYFQSCFPPLAAAVSESPFIAFSVLSTRTLVSLEEAEAIRSGSDSLAGAPIAWPAFVAACVAPPRLRSRWTAYWETHLNYRIGNLPHVWEVVKAVWKQSDASTSDGLPCGDSSVQEDLTLQTEPPNASWTPVLQQMNINILAV